MSSSSSWGASSSRDTSVSDKSPVSPSSINEFTSRVGKSSVQLSSNVIDLTKNFDEETPRECRASTANSQSSNITGTEEYEYDYTDTQNTWILENCLRIHAEIISWEKFAQEYHDVFQQARTIVSLQRQLLKLRASKKNYGDRASIFPPWIKWTEEEIDWLYEYCEQYEDRRAPNYWYDCAKMHRSEFGRMRGPKALQRKWFTMNHNHRKMVSSIVSPLCVDIGSSGKNDSGRNQNGTLNGNSSLGATPSRQIGADINIDKHTAMDTAMDRVEVPARKTVQKTVEATAEEQKRWLLENGGGLTRGMMSWSDCTKEFNRIFNQKRDMGSILCEWYRLPQSDHFKDLGVAVSMPLV